MITRRKFFSGAAALASASALFNRVARGAEMLAGASRSPEATGYTPVITPNGSTLPWKMVDGAKEFHLVAEPVKREFAPGMIVNCWGYNGQTPGPTIEAIEGDRVRFIVTNKLPEPTTVHWHGAILPNGMDGVAGLTQKPIDPGKSAIYEFTLRQHGTLMYHPHFDEMLQMAMGMMGFFIIHPKQAPVRIDRDYAIFLMEWAIAPGTYTPNPNIMTDFNIFTFNSRVWPGTAPLLAQVGERVRVRLANLSMDNHPIHMHGQPFRVTGTDGGIVPESARYPENTVDVPVGATRDIEFVAENPGDWSFHCHKSHHTMNAMSHDIPNMIGVNQSGAVVNKLVPGTMAMGSAGMGEMAEMQMASPKNTLPMMSGTGPFGSIAMGGMFTILKIREHLDGDNDPGFYTQPAGTSVTLTT
jgi:FtsP/CotA-like multicopper oxidase with cupredoxin domain